MRNPLFYLSLCAKQVPVHPQLGCTPWIYDRSGQLALDSIYRGVFTIAEEAGLPLLITAPTWRANRKLMRESDIPDTVNRDAVGFMQGLGRELGWNMECPVSIEHIVTGSFSHSVSFVAGLPVTPDRFERRSGSRRLIPSRHRPQGSRKTVLRQKRPLRCPLCPPASAPSGPTPGPGRKALEPRWLIPPNPKRFAAPPCPSPTQRCSPVRSPETVPERPRRSRQ